MRVRDVPLRGTRRLSQWAAELIPAPKPEGPCIVETIHGFKMLVDPVLDQGVELAIFSAGTYESGTLFALDAFLEGGGSFIDVGANVGLMTLFAAKRLGRFGQVLAFEAMPSTYEILRHNIELNGYSNVTAVNVAVGSMHSTAEIFNNSDMNRGGATLMRPSTSIQGVTVPVVPLDEYLAENRITNVNCIKVDVEGWELEVLRGAKSLLSRPDAPRWIIECSREHPTFAGVVEDIYDTLIGANAYQVFRLCKSKERPSRLLRIGRHELPEHDNVFCLLPAHTAELPARLRPK